MQREAHALYQQATPDCAREQVRLALHSEDDRVRTINCEHIIKRTLGDGLITPEDAGTKIDVEKLSAAERLELARAISTMRRLSAIAENQTAEIEGSAE